MSNSQGSSEINKEALYGEHMKRVRWTDKLFKRAAHKSLDIPEDDMNINHQTQGISGKTILGLGAMALAGTLGWRALTSVVAPPEATAPSPAASQSFEVLFWAEDGTPIEVVSKEVE